MYARSTTMHAEPRHLAEAITFVTDEVMPAMRAVDGFVGLSMMADRTSGRFITTTAWQDRAALQRSEAVGRELRDGAVGRFGATAQVDRWEIEVLHRAEQAGDGACVRVTWTRTDTVRVERAIETYRSTLLPAMELLPGFRSASLFVDRATGRAVSSVTYADRAAMTANRDAANDLRRSAVQENDVQVLEVAEFELVLAHLHVPELV